MAGHDVHTVSEVGVQAADSYLFALQVEQGVHDVDPAADHALGGQARHDNGPAMYEPAGQVVQVP